MNIFLIFFFSRLLTTVELYHPKRDQWMFLKSMPEALMGLSCTVLDGCVFAIGGIANEGHSSQYTVTNHTYAFDFEKQVLVFTNYFHFIQL